jgi:hypothetical protein
MSREKVPENPFPSSYEEGGAAEGTMDDLGLFQEIDVPPALGAVDQDPDWGFNRRVHSNFFGTRIKTDDTDKKEMILPPAYRLLVTGHE